MEGIEGNTVASPTVTENYVIIGSSAPDQSMALHRQVELPSNSRVAWKAEDASSSFGSPLATKDYLYLVNRAGVATCHDLKTGKKVWNLRLPGSCLASPMHALGRIYFFTKDGKTIVIGSNGSDKVLAENELSIEGRIYGVSAVNKAFVIRTGTELICVGSISNRT
jgi:outer membrane protein assembly factor BamB